MFGEIDTSAAFDNDVVDQFAIALKKKMAKSRAKGRSGWNDPTLCSNQFLADMFLKHLNKSNAGNYEDLAVLLMMLWYRDAEPAYICRKNQG